MTVSKYASMKLDHIDVAVLMDTIMTQEIVQVRSYEYIMEI